MVDLAARITASVEVFYGVRGVGSCKLSIPQAAREIIDAGFGVEVLFADHWSSEAPASERTIEELAAVCKDAPIATTHALVNAWVPDLLRDEIRAARRVGISQMVVHPYCLGQGIDGVTVRPQEVRDICTFARDHGVLLVLENLGKTGITSMRETIDIVGDDPAETGMGLCVDVGHANRSCTDDGIRPEAFLTEFRDLIREVHVDDNHGTQDLHLPPGMGSMDWPPIIDAMLDLRDDTVICLEIAWPHDPLRALRDSRNLLVKSNNCKAGSTNA